MHLARTVEHTVDVDGMLERMTPRQFDEWHELYQVAPWGDDWKQAGTIASVVHNELTILLSAYAGEQVKLKMLDEPGDYIPTVQERERPQIQDQADFVAMMRKQIGV